MMMELEHNQAKAAASKCIQREVWDLQEWGWFSNIFATEELQEETTDCAAAAAPLCT